MNASRSLAISCEKVGDDLLKSGDTTDGLKFYRRSLVLRETLSTADPANVQGSRDLAGTYSKLGDIHAQLASTVHADRQHWREAQAWYQRSLDIWVGLRKRNVLKSADTKELDRIALAVATCDAKLK